jgi:hypothetical protein
MRPRSINSRFQKCAPKPTSARAHKLARILWHLLKYKEPFKPEVFAQAEARMQRRKLARLQNLAPPSTINSSHNPCKPMT